MMVGFATLFYRSVARRARDAMEWVLIVCMIALMGTGLWLVLPEVLQWHPASQVLVLLVAVLGLCALLYFLYFWGGWGQYYSSRFEAVEIRHDPPTPTL